MAASCHVWFLDAALASDTARGVLRRAHLEWLLDRRQLAVGSAPTLELSTVRFIIAVIVLAAIAIVTRTGLGRGNLWPVVIAGGFGYFGYNASSSLVS